MSQKRAKNKTVMDSESEEVEEIEEVGSKVVLRSPEKGMELQRETSAVLAFEVTEEIEAVDDGSGHGADQPGQGEQQMEEKDDEVVVLDPLPVFTLQLQGDASTSPADVIEIVESEIKGVDHLVTDQPRRIGRHAKKGPSSPVLPFNGTQESKRSRIITTYKKSPKSRSLKETEVAARSMDPYVELLSFSPARLSSYTNWKPSSSKIPEPVVDDYTDGDLDILVDEVENVPAISMPPSRFRSVERSASVELPRKTMNTKKRAPPLLVSPGSSSSSTKERSKKRLKPTRAGILSEAATNGASRKRVSFPTKPSETSAGFLKVGKTTDEKRRRQVREEEDQSARRRAKEKDRTAGPKHRHKRRPFDQPKGGKLKRSTRDPDEVEDAMTEEEGDLLEELEFDEPERFKSKTRLRKRKETPFQRKLRKFKAQREGIAMTGTSSDSSSDGQRTYTSDSAPPTENSSLGTDEFIIDDGGRVQEGLLPFQFSSNSAQTPEFKFKVIFHYFVLLVIGGPKKLPLRGETAEYLLPQLEDMRRKISGYRNSRVRSQIWRADFVKTLEKYPNFRVGR